MLNFLISVALLASVVGMFWFRRPQDYLNAIKLSMAFGVLSLVKAVVISSDEIIGTILYAFIGGFILGVAVISLVLDKSLDGLQK